MKLRSTVMILEEALFDMADAIVLPVPGQRRLASLSARRFSADSSAGHFICNRRIIGRSGWPGLFICLSGFCLSGFVRPRLVRVRQQPPQNNPPIAELATRRRAPPHLQFSSNAQRDFV